MHTFCVAVLTKIMYTFVKSQSYNIIVDATSSCSCSWVTDIIWKTWL